jgi:hypothetical protein
VVAHLITVIRTTATINLRIWRHLFCHGKSISSALLPLLFPRQIHCLRSSINFGEYVLCVFFLFVSFFLFTVRLKIMFLWYQHRTLKRGLIFCRRLEYVSTLRKTLQRDIETPFFYNALFLSCLTFISILSWLVLVRITLVRLLGRDAIDEIRLWIRGDDNAADVCLAPVLVDLFKADECEQAPDLSVGRTWATLRTVVEIALFSTNFQSVGVVDVLIVAYFVVSCMIGLVSLFPRIRTTTLILSLQQAIGKVGLVLISGLALPLVTHSLGLASMQLAQVYRTPELELSHDVRLCYCLAFIARGVVAVWETMQWFRRTS